MPNLVRWDVPFADARHPSVSLITEEGGDAATLVVAPGGVDQYPKYLVRFTKVLLMLCYEEALALERGYGLAQGSQPQVCAYTWTDSSWLRAGQTWAEFLGLSDLRHYVVFGGDSVVELLATGASEAERVDRSTALDISHRV